MNETINVKRRTWPGIVTGIVIVAGFFSSIIVPDAAIVGIPAALIATLSALLWWLFFSRVRLAERITVLALIVAAWIATRPFLHISIIGGAMGGLPALAFPVLFAALGFWAWGTRNSSDKFRRAALIPAVLIACVFCTLVRTAGIGRNLFEFHWRWTPTPEEVLLARENDDPATIPATVAPATITEVRDAKANTDSNADKPVLTMPSTAAEWPGFRGPARDGVIHNVRIETDWSKSPPMEIWRQAIGPGWSSFAVGGELIYTQEQRGSDELVSAYYQSTGKPAWRHRDAVRFYESNGGPGPRGTPTVVNGRVYSFGGTGIVNALDAGTGAVIWSRDASADTRVEIPDWGFSSSPLVIEDLVVVAASGTLAAYDIATGKPRWFSPAGGFSYSSPHLISIEGIPQIVFVNGKGAISMAPSDGTVLWQTLWDGGGIVQPAVTAEGDVLLPTTGFTGGQGIRRLAVTHKSGEWNVEEKWTSNGLKPYFNDFVVHKGHAYGFDGDILSSIDLADGKRKWKGGRYGSGQLVLLADQDLLLVVSDEGELVLVSATPDGFKEISRFKAIEGKTWNHPVVVRDMLIVRNGEEMAAFRLATARE
jgi:outer membrane protein assembly factor BamB